jgi:hypothetical protein
MSDLEVIVVLFGLGLATGVLFIPWSYFIGLWIYKKFWRKL